MKVVWWSGGITSALAAWIEWDATPIYLETGAHHPDLLRFKRDCERWYKREILTLQNTKYRDHFDVIAKTRYVNGVGGARCTMELKRKVRMEWEKDKTDLTYVWGFEYSAKEIKRAEQTRATVPYANHIFPLIDLKLTKQDAVNMVKLDPPMMYKLGFLNNNCVGCVKGGAAYWNKIRVLFPDVFWRMALLEREVGHSCLRRSFLDALDPEAGRGSPPLVMDCGAIGEGCEIEKSRAFLTRE